MVYYPEFFLIRKFGDASQQLSGGGYAGGGSGKQRDIPLPTM